MPALFFGHGNPMNAVLTNATPRPGAASGGSCHRPRAILAISAHWISLTPGHQQRRSATIHDFGGFPVRALPSAISGARRPALARRVQIAAGSAFKWHSMTPGDSIMAPGRYCAMFIRTPTCLSCSLVSRRRQPAIFTSRSVSASPTLRGEGVLIAGSGNLVHNLHTYAWGRHPAIPTIGRPASGESGASI